MPDDSILARIGLRGRDGDGGGGGAAIQALRRLVESGKVSVDDARAAVEAARGTAENNGDEAADANGNCDVEGNGSNGKKKSKKKQPDRKSHQPPIKYRTRHVALQFSYDGTDFSGFAENVGKECDNSVEKALFAAMEKTRLLVSPEENGMLMTVDNEDGKNTAGDGEDVEADGSDGGGPKVGDGSASVSKRAASKYSRCGRTDKGVHAHGQVVALYLKSAFPLLARQAGSDGDDVPLEEDSLPKNSLDGLECLVPPKKKAKGDSNGTDASKALQNRTITELDYPRILNNVLPPSIRVLGWCPVSSEFSARFSCSRRTYRYFFPRRNLDLSATAQGLQYMMGRHDFRNMCKMNCEQVYNFERVIMSGKVVSPQKVYVVCANEDKESSTNSSIQEVEGCASSTESSPHDMCHVEIVGQAFLWHQIRCIMSVLFYIGRKLESPELVNQLFDIGTNPAKPAYEMASETALVLQDCQFRNLKLGRTVRNLWDVTKVLEQRWEEHAVAAERANDALESIKSETEVRWTDVVDFVQQVDRERKRKEQKRTKMLLSDDGDIKQDLEKRAPETAMISWGSAVSIIQDVLGVYPHLPNGSGEGQRKGLTESSIHVPMMERSKGTTYEEKVQSILGEGTEKNGKSSKRKERYEENIIKKRKTSEEDEAFYDHMLRQGGSSM